MEAKGQTVASPDATHKQAPATATNTPVPPTNASVPPTNTPVPPANTPVSPADTPTIQPVVAAVTTALGAAGGQPPPKLESSATNPISGALASVLLGVGIAMVAAIVYLILRRR